MASVFTKIINGEIPSYKVAEDENYYAFLDINPVVPGHTLVVPKHEVDNLFDLEDGELGGLFVFAKKVAASLQKNIECKKVAVVVIGLEVPHAHVHLLPISKEGDIDFSNKSKMSDEEMLKIQRAIKLF